MIYIEKLSRIIKKQKSHLIIGLDTDIKKIPFYFKKYKNPVLTFNKVIIDITKDFVAGYKINTAFYEASGYHGFEILELTNKYIPDNLLKICDAKRGDIGNSSEMYAKAYFKYMNFDSLTVNPLLGKDSIEPFINYKNKFIYVLVHTSNSGSEDFQKLKYKRKCLYDVIVEKLINWNIYKNIGFVVGANHLSLLKKLTVKYTKIPVLIPGIGFQNNDLKLLMKNLYNDYFLINSSRAIIYSSVRTAVENVFFNSVIDSAKKLNEKINSLKIFKKKQK